MQFIFSELNVLTVKSELKIYQLPTPTCLTQQKLSTLKHGDSNTNILDSQNITS